MFNPLHISAFQSTPSVGRATVRYFDFFGSAGISIHALRGEGDLPAREKEEPIAISIHALRGEGDSSVWFGSRCRVYFNPRPPWGGRRLTFWSIVVKAIFQSTPSVGRATAIDLPNAGYTYAISIHALRGEGDHAVRVKFCVKFISIHALRGEGDCKNIQIYNIAFVHSVYKIIYFCDSCAFYLT